MWTPALCSQLEPRIPGTILRSLWWCFVLFTALLGFTWVSILRHSAVVPVVGSSLIVELGFVANVAPNITPFTEVEPNADLHMRKVS